MSEKSLALADLTINLDKDTLETYSSIDKYYGDDDIAKDILQKKYLAPWEKSPLDMWVRLAVGCAQAETFTMVDYYTRQFFNLLSDFTFIPGGRINYGLGRDDIKVSFSNCYILPIKDDSLDAIYTSIKEEAFTYKTGGGAGHDLSILRPAGDWINGTGGGSCGPVGFMELYSVSTDTVAQNARRGANMQTLLVSHPDIEKFINVKNEAKEAVAALSKLSKLYPESNNEIKIISDLIESKRAVQHSNISTKLTDEFMSSVDNNSEFNLTWNNKIYKTINANSLWNNIITNAWESGEPGCMFWDRIVENYNLQYVNPVICTNPCGEVPGGAYSNCLLGHLNLPKFVETDKNGIFFNFDKFKLFVGLAVRFLDNVIDLNNGRHALKEQNDIAMNERRIGLGITGVGDLFVMMGLKYGSIDSMDFITKIMEALRDTSYETSCDLAKEKGSFPWYNADGLFQSKFIQNLPEHIQTLIKSRGLRNSILLTCAPVGTGSIIAQTSSGIEPIFRSFYTRKVKQPDGISFKEYKVYHPLIKNLFSSTDNLPDYVVDSTQISPEDRVRTQAIIQKYIDNSISSTVNLPKSATKEDVANIYMLAWKLGCKGITVYREGSREGILISNNNEIIENKNERIVPKRPSKLDGETYKLKIDITGEKPYNCYVTVNFKEGTKKPYEILVTETSANKEIKDIIAFETTTRLVSLALRHNVPIQFIIGQLEKINCQYIYSLPISIANILSNYLDYEDESYEGEKCPSCGEFSIKRENGCVGCINCGYSKCNG